MYNVSYVVFSLVNVSVFHITWLDTFWTDLCISKELKAADSDTCTPMFIAAVFNSSQNMETTRVHQQMNG